jgi:hypothetical protein
VLDTPIRKQNKNNINKTWALIWIIALILCKQTQLSDSIVLYTKSTHSTFLDDQHVSFDIRTNKYVFLQYTTAWASERCEALKHCKWIKGYGYGIWRHFQQYFSYIMKGSFIGRGNRSTQRNLLTCHKSLTPFIT